MKKVWFMLTLCFITSTYAEQESICVDTTQVEQTVMALKHIASALAALAQKVELLLHSEQAKVPTRNINFDAWKEVIDQSRPTKESSHNDKE